MSQENNWDLTRLFPSLESSEFKVSLENFISQGDRLLQRVKDLGDRDWSALDEILLEINQLSQNSSVLGSYVYAITTTDSFNNAAQVARGKVLKGGSAVSKANSLLVQWLGKYSPEEVISNSEQAKSHEHFVRRASVAATHQMTGDLEELAADLSLNGAQGWSRLYGNFTSQIQVEFPDGREALPMSAVRAMAYHPDRAVRKAGFEAELKTWEKHSLVIATCLNSIKGSTVTLSERRNWKAEVDQALFSEGITDKALHAMLAAAKSKFPVFQRYFRAKAKFLKVDACRFYDIFAPVGRSESNWSYDEAKKFVSHHFHGFGKDLGDLADRSYRERWIDVYPKPGKVDGAYCSGNLAGESLVLMNFKESFGSVSTLAHELGHAYHNFCLRDRTSIQKRTPMSLAETASTFCETIIKKAAIANGDENQKLEILEASLQGSTQVVVDIYSRYLFESSALEARAKGELGANDFCEMMVAAQKATYGDGLAADGYHPYMWAAKPHYYGRSFYNFPYMFGLLFGLGLYQCYKQMGPEFNSRYAELLSSTGMLPAAELASGFGIDIETEAFWLGSLQQIEDDVSLFESLVG